MLNALNQAATLELREQPELTELRKLRQPPSSIRDRSPHE